jgi:hypothetical protein
VTVLTVLTVVTVVTVVTVLTVVTVVQCSGGESCESGVSVAIEFLKFVFLRE